MDKKISFQLAVREVLKCGPVLTSSPPALSRQRLPARIRLVVKVASLRRERCPGAAALSRGLHTGHQAWDPLGRTCAHVPGAGLLSVEVLLCAGQLLGQEGQVVGQVFPSRGSGLWRDVGICLSAGPGCWGDTEAEPLDRGCRGRWRVPSR